MKMLGELYGASVLVFLVAYELKTSPFISPNFRWGWSKDVEKLREMSLQKQVYIAKTIVDNGGCKHCWASIWTLLHDNC